MQRSAAPVTLSRHTHRWLPDGELDAHPVGTWLLELGFDLWVRAGYRRVVLLPQNFHIEPGTLIASNHQRDVDGPMLGTVLVRRHGLRFTWPLPFFATREDLFRPGILARLTVHWPRPISALLGRISLAWFFPLGRAEPMRRIREFTLGESLQALLDAGCGAREAASLLNPRGLRALGSTGRLPLAELVSQAPGEVLERWWGLRCLHTRALKLIGPDFRATIDAQLAHFAQRLDRGRCVYFAPEGTISMDGHFSRVRGGLFRLVHLAHTPPWIQPMAIGYDTLAPGRSRVVVRIGPRCASDASLDRRKFDASLRRTILDLVPITPSHLLARWLLHGPAMFTREELAAWFRRSMATLRSRHASFDPRLVHGNLAALASERLRWLERKHLIVRRGERFINACARDAAPGWQAPANIARYLDNQLHDLVPEIDRTLPC